MDGRNYAIVTAAYWGFTLTDGALRMLVLLHFHALGYSPLQLAFLFLLYEFCGIITNLFGGWIGSRFGLKLTLFAGLATQIIALTMLSLLQPTWAVALSVAYVMAAQALSGIAKDLTKMSSKSAVKLLVPRDQGDQSAEGRALFKWVAVLTGSKNALKGVGFFLGGILLATLGFEASLWAMAGGLLLILLAGVIMLEGDLGKSKQKTKFTQLFAKSPEINALSAARFFLFASRDIWFVVGLPVFLRSVMGWSFTGVGGFMAAWVIGYGIVQAAAPSFVHGSARSAIGWGALLALVTAAIAAAVQFDFYPEVTILLGLAIFGVVFAVNSAVHSYLILAYTDEDKVALNVGFYYMANACGRLVGTLLSGLLYVWAGLPACLWASAAFVLAAVLLTLRLPRGDDAPHQPIATVAG
ncbi:MAG: organoarsenical effux MFS transporter ArsJ [Verrucomicrobiales bacterium]